MNAAVRYYSRSGNTKMVAEALADVFGVKAVSVDSTEAKLEGEVDILFVGGALYAYGIDNKLKDYLRSADLSGVKKAAVFSTSWLSKHALDLIRRELEAKGVEVVNETCYVRGKPGADDLKNVKAFAEGFR